MAIINGRGRVGIRRPSAAAAPSIILDGLKLYLDAGNATSYAGTGTVWTDLSGNGNNGTLINGPTFNGANGGSIVFDGSNDYVDCGSSFAFGTGPFTISVWYKVTNNNTNYSIVWSSGGGSNGEGVLTANYSNAVANYYASGFRITNSAALVKNIWYNTVLVGNGGVNGSRNIKLYTNSNQVGVTYTTNYIFSNGRFLIGANSAAFAEVMRGNISNVQIYNRALSAAEIAQNYNAMLSRFYPIVSDADAQSFVVAAGLTSSVQANAVNTLVASLKSAGIWTKMKAIYPMVGGSAASHKFNLKDPRDLDAAFRLAFTAGWVHSSTGAKPNSIGTGDYANTFFTPNSLSSIHTSYYSRTNISVTSNQILFDAFQAGGAQTYQFYFDTNGNIYHDVFNTGGGRINISFSSTNGFYIGSRLNLTSNKIYKNSNLIVSNSNGGGTLPTIPLYMAAANTSGGAVVFSKLETAFASIGDGLTDTEASNLYTAVQAYQTTLGRQV